MKNFIRCMAISLLASLVEAGDHRKARRFFVLDLRSLCRRGGSVAAEAGLRARPVHRVGAVGADDDGAAVVIAAQLPGPAALAPAAEVGGGAGRRAAAQRLGLAHAVVT